VKNPRVESSYRDRIYEKYATGFQDVPESLDIAAAARWRKAYGFYFQGWLPVSKQAQIADVACGSGNLLRFFAENGYPHICGVDISQEQVSLARQVTPEVEAGNAIEFLEARPAQFDLITGLDIIEHFNKPEVLRFLDGCHTALKPGGRLILQTPNADSPWGAMHRYNDFTHEVCFTPNALTRLMRLTKFEFIEPRETKPIPFGYSMTSTVRYLVWEMIRLGLNLWNLAETGSTGSNIFTRVFLISGIRK
jgi:2-polyprenyl-3-methyl-5-hydroxy-6-metoxy-1,4-benzoquinol methylase